MMQVIEFRHCYVAWGADEDGNSIYRLCNVSGGFRMALPVKFRDGIAPNNDYVGKKIEFLQKHDPRFQFYDESVDFKENHVIEITVGATYTTQVEWLESTLEWIRDSIHNPWCFDIGRTVGAIGGMSLSKNDLIYRFVFSDIQDAVLFRLKF